MNNFNESVKDIFSSWNLVPTRGQTMNETLNIIIKVLIIVLIIGILLSWAGNIILIIIVIIALLFLYKMWKKEPYVLINDDGTLMAASSEGQPFLRVNYPGCVRCTKEAKCTGCKGCDSIGQQCGLGCSSMTRPVGEIYNPPSPCACVCGQSPCTCAGPLATTANRLGAGLPEEFAAGAILSAKNDIASSFRQEQDDYRRGMIERFLDRKQREFSREGLSNRLSHF